ncbi:hypothetical protein E4U53_006189, partial [Claviceps sorghi]
MDNKSPLRASPVSQSTFASTWNKSMASDAKQPTCPSDAGTLRKNDLLRSRPHEGLHLPLYDRALIIKAANLGDEPDPDALRPPPEVSDRMDPDILQSYKNKIEEREIEHDKARFWKGQRRDHIRGAMDHPLIRWEKRRANLMAVHRVPWLNMETRTAEWGLHCYACLQLFVVEEDKANDFLAEYLVSTFEKHMDEYDEGRSGYHLKEGCYTKIDTLETCRYQSDRCWTCIERFRDSIDHRYFWN